MAYVPDLERGGYARNQFGEQLTAIGWLEADHPYSRGDVAPEVFDRLVAICRTEYVVGMYIGYQECSICPSPKLQRETTIALPLGNRNYVVPGEGEVLYHFPDLILHYIRDHGYAPPLEFCEAVLKCPDPDSPEYLAYVDRFIVKWPAGVAL